MNKEQVLTQKAFDSLLNWLDPDRDRAAQTYEKIRIRLIKILTCRGCCEAEDLADEAINRVTLKVDWLILNYVGDPARYFYAVAQKVYLEYLRKTKHQQVSPVSVSSIAADPDQKQLEALYECLERCLDKLSKENRLLVIEYYHGEKQAKIKHRKKIADQLGIGVNALRIRAHRIRLQLEGCVQNCLKQSPAQ